MKKILSLMLLSSLGVVNAQSSTVTLDEQLNTSGISNSAPSYQPVKEVPSQSKQSMYPDWVNKIKEPAISEDIRPEIRETVRQIKTKPTIKESDKVQEVIDEMFPNKIDVVTYKAPPSQTVKPVEQKPAISVYEYQNSKKQNSVLLNVFLPLLIIFCMILFFVWIILKNKTDVKLDIATTPKTKDNYIPYSKREEKLKDILIESAKQTLVFDLREMEIRGILDDRDITIQTLLRTYEEISLDQVGEYSKSANIPKIEVEKIIKSTYQMLQVQYYKS